MYIYHMRVAIYARVSTIDKQDYQRQVEDLKDIIQKNNEYKNHSIDTFTEKISGYKKENDRPKLEELLDILRTDNNYYSCIFVSEISRIGRDPFHTRKVIDELTNLKVPIYIESLNRKTIDKNGDRDGILSIILQVLIEYSDMEAETFKKRSRSGLFNSAKQGKAGGGIYFPYGYLKDDNGMLKIDEEEKKVIEKIFKLYKEGLGIKKISNSLNKDKIPTRTAKISLEKNKSENACKTKWSDKQVHDILQNTIYIGKRRWKGKDRETHIEIEAENLRIISDELFFNCKDIRENKTTRDYRTSYTYLLKDIIYCGKCGRKYFAKYKPKKGGDKVYICSSRIGNNTSCNNDGINIALIESVLFNELISSERVLKYINDASEIITNTKSEIKQLQKDLTIEKEKRIGIDEKITRAYLGYVNHETLIDLYNNTITELNNEISKSTKQEARILADILKKEGSLKKISQVNSKKNDLMKMKNNRDALKKTYNLFFQRIIINKIDDKYFLVTVIVTIRQEILNNYIYFLVDKSGLRKKNKKIYSYFGFTAMENTPVFSEKDNLLLTDINDIKNEIYSYIKYEDFEFTPNPRIIIPDENIITIPVPVPK